MDETDRNVRFEWTAEYMAEYTAYYGVSRKLAMRRPVLQPSLA
jgi:hypothetical protein